MAAETAMAGELELVRFHHTAKTPKSSKSAHAAKPSAGGRRPAKKTGAKRVTVKTGARRTTVRAKVKRRKVSHGKRPATRRASRPAAHRKPARRPAAHRARGAAHGQRTHAVVRHTVTAKATHTARAKSAPVKAPARPVTRNHAAATVYGAPVRARRPAGGVPKAAHPAKASHVPHNGTAHHEQYKK
jgi:hypothetical protein